MRPKHVFLMFFTLGMFPLVAESGSGNSLAGADACVRYVSDGACIFPATDDGEDGMSLLIWTFGDSNAAKDDGWVVQLQKLLSDSYIHNTSRSGRTIGFDNLDNL